MIKVTKLNGKNYHLNALYIESVESQPDTIITLTNGNKLIVADSEDDIVQSMVRFYRSIQTLGKCTIQEEFLNEE